MILATYKQITTSFASESTKGLTRREEAILKHKIIINRDHDQDRSKQIAFETQHIIWYKQRASNLPILRITQRKFQISVKLEAVTINENKTRKADTWGK